jgi:hypothetical protein
MRRLLALNAIWPSLLAVGVAGCGSLNRTATLGLTTKTIRVPGATTEMTLEEQLARKGFPAAKVSCAQTIVVHVGVRTACHVGGAGDNRTVRFTFKNAGGEINPSSVKASA